LAPALRGRSRTHPARSRPRERLPDGGYTDAGTEYAYALSTDNIVVAEEIERRRRAYRVDQQISMILAEASASNMQLC